MGTTTSLRTPADNGGITMALGEGGEDRKGSYMSGPRLLMHPLGYQRHAGMENNTEGTEQVGRSGE